MKKKKNEKEIVNFFLTKKIFLSLRKTHYNQRISA